MKRILSIDGGGIRGVIPATIIATFEQQTGKAAATVFDLLAGTSTGGIIAIGLVAGVPATKLLSLYVDRGNEIFANPDLLHGALRPRYSAAGLEIILQEILGQAWLSEVKGPELLVPAACLSPVQTDWFFKSWKANGSVLNVDDEPTELDFKLWEIARATSAAPTYFPTAKLTSKAGKEYYMSDGGTFCNNPALAAWAAAKDLWPDEELQVFSIGTGMPTPRPLNGPASQGWGDLEWITEGQLVSMCMSGTAEATSYILDCLNGRGIELFRIQTTIPPEVAAMDNASSTNIGKLVSIAKNLALSRSAIYPKLVA